MHKNWSAKGQTGSMSEWLTFFSRPARGFVVGVKMLCLWGSWAAHPWHGVPATVVAFLPRYAFPFPNMQSVGGEARWLHRAGAAGLGFCNDRLCGHVLQSPGMLKIKMNTEFLTSDRKCYWLGEDHKFRRMLEWGVWPGP